MKKRLSVVCSGTGYFSQFHYEAWTRLEDVKVVGICNRNGERAKSFSMYYDIPIWGDDLNEMLEGIKPDVLDVITPPNTHLAAVKLAAKYGVDVICQKPFGENLEQAREMVEIAHAAGIKLIVHENFRFMPWYRVIKEVVDSGRLGEVLNVQFNLRSGDGQGKEAYLDRQAYFQTMPKFLIHETAIHIVDVFRFLFGEPQFLYAQLRRCNPSIAGEDAGLVVFEFDNQMQAIFDGNRLLDHRATNTRRTMGELSIAGTQAQLNLDGEGRIWLRAFKEESQTELEFDWLDQNFGGDCVYETIAHIVSHYINASPLENQGFEYLRNIEIENAIYQSAEQGKKLDLHSNIHSMRT